MKKHTFRFLGSPCEQGLWKISQLEEIHHAQKVLRLSSGAVVEVFDGDGAVIQGEITALSSSQILVAVKSRTFCLRKKKSLHMVLSVLRSQLVEDSIASLVEVGVDTLHLYPHPQCMKKSLSDNSLNRLKRIALNATKQSKNAFLLDIKIWNCLEECLDFLKTFEASFTRLDIEGENLSQVKIPVSRDHALICASEAGYTQDDKLLVQERKISTCSLGSQVLRASTALTVGGALYRLKLDAEDFNL